MGPSQVLVQVDRFWTELEGPPVNLSAAWQLLDRQAKTVALMKDRLGSKADADLLWWTRSYELQLQDHLQELVLMAPWLMLPLWIMEHPIPEDFLDRDSNEPTGLKARLLRLDGIPLLREVPETARHNLEIK